MSDWDDFLTFDNFMLAWNRVLRSMHYSNKDRIGFRIYAANLEPNLKYLIKSVQEGIYQPASSDKIYSPKRPGTVRSLPVLNMNDRIVYQAIGNIIAKKSKESFEAIVEGYVYAHLLTDFDNPFMIRRWSGKDGQYRRFQNRFKQLWNYGNCWVVTADIASYYDSIDHELLAKDLRERWLDCDELMNQLLDCLRNWSQHEDGIGFSRGLPQGYETSDYLATLFLLPTDENMIQNGAQYLRYVDDIRIFAPDRDSASKALLDLDITLKKQALILQPSKTGAREIKDIDTEVDHLTGLLSLIDLSKRNCDEDTDEKVNELFFQSWNSFNNGDDEHAEAHLIFALNRVNPSPRVREIAISMMHNMPWRSDYITRHLSNYVGDEEVIRVLFNEVNNHKVYAWHLANSTLFLRKQTAFLFFSANTGGF